MDMIDWNKEYEKCKKDYIYFILNYCKDKNGNPIELKDYQKEFLNKCMRSDKVLINLHLRSPWIKDEFTTQLLKDYYSKY